MAKNKYIINIGDTFSTKLSNISFLKCDRFPDTALKSKYLDKSIFPINIKKYFADYEDVLTYLNSHIIIRYIGRCKFEELISHEVILFDPMYDYELKDNPKFHIAERYKTYHEIEKDIDFINNTTPLFLCNNAPDNGSEDLLNFISRSNALKYVLGMLGYLDIESHTDLKYKVTNHQLLLFSFRNLAQNVFKESLQEQIELDHEDALCENQKRKSL